MLDSVNTVMLLQRLYAAKFDSPLNMQPDLLVSVTILVSYSDGPDACMSATIWFC